MPKSRKFVNCDDNIGHFFELFDRYPCVFLRLSGKKSKKFSVLKAQFEELVQISGWGLSFYAHVISRTIMTFLSDNLEVFHTINAKNFNLSSNCSKLLNLLKTFHYRSNLKQKIPQKEILLKLRL